MSNSTTNQSKLDSLFGDLQTLNPDLEAYEAQKSYCIRLVDSRDSIGSRKQNPDTAKQDNKDYWEASLAVVAALEKLEQLDETLEVKAETLGWTEKLQALDDQEEVATLKSQYEQQIAAASKTSNNNKLTLDRSVNGTEASINPE